MNVADLEIRLSAGAKEKLIFLIENKIQKGRLALMYQLYQPEIHSLSLVGAAKIITKDLGYPIGIQTIRTLRKKSGDFGRDRRTEWEQKGNSAPRKISSIETCNHKKTHDSAPMGLEGFKPLDVFSEEYLKKQSAIKWARPSNS